MIKRSRKGRISNELVATSCAAILAVYAAGAWRTRDAAQRFLAEGQTRRPARPAPPVPVPSESAPAAVAAVTSSPESTVQPANVGAPLVAKVPLQVQPQPSPKPAALTQPSEPATTSVAQGGTAEKPEPAAEIQQAPEVAEDAVAAAPAHKPWLDGYYTGWGTSRHGDIQAFVSIEGGRIVNAGVATCETRYPCSVIDGILLQPIELQGPDVDRVSRATESGDAYYYGLVAALENAETGTFKSKRP